MSERQQPFVTNLFAHRPFRYGDLTITYCMNRHWQLFKNTFWDSRMSLVRDALSILSVSWWPPTFPIEWAEIRQSSWIVGLSARLLRHIFRTQPLHLLGLLPSPLCNARPHSQLFSSWVTSTRCFFCISSPWCIRDEWYVPEWRSYFLIDSWMG